MWCDGQKCVLKRKAKPSMRQARKLFARSVRRAPLHREANYAPKRGRENAVLSSRGRAGRRKEPKDNPRFVITNLKQTPQWIYEKGLLSARRIENRTGCAGETGEE